MQNELCMCPWTWNISFNDLVNFADIFYLSAAFLFLLSHCDLLEILAPAFSNQTSSSVAVEIHLYDRPVPCYGYFFLLF